MRTPEENAAHFVEILRNGGVLVAHPDTLAELDAKPFVKLMVPVLMDCHRVPNRYVENGNLYACAIPAFAAEFPMTTLAESSASFRRRR